MREFLFRAKTFGGKWVYGNLIRQKSSDGIESCYIREIDVDKDVVCIKHIDKKTITQFTGLIDSAGNKIFEGDIIEGTLRSQWNKRKIRCVVEYRRDGFVANDKMGKVSFEHKVMFAKDITVVGNIYDKE